MRYASLATLIAAVVLAGSAARADDTIGVHGGAPQVCSLGSWLKSSGAGSFSGGLTAVNTFSNADMVDGSAMSVLGSGQTLNFRAPLLCNTAITWTLTTTKGAFRQDAALTPPAGFANQWLYDLSSAPYNSGGTAVSSVSTITADGTPFDGETHSLTPTKSMQIAYFGVTFVPAPQTARMLAGAYSEDIVLTVTPSL